MMRAHRVPSRSDPVGPLIGFSVCLNLTIVLAALAVSRWFEAAIGWSVRKFVRTARRYRRI
jgi:hypothetical protein